MITSGSNTFVYNDRNQLIRIESGAGALVSYEYNWQGLRSKKIIAVRTENYYYTGDDLAYITDDANKVKYFFTRDTSGTLLHMIDYTGATPVIYFYIRDAHGNIVALADNTGVRKVNYEYDAWGLLINVPENNVFTGNGELLRDANPFRYSGYQFDPETEFYYLKNRYYSAVLGRFITEDVIMSKNRYMYCSNNPVNFVDPSGLIEKDILEGGVNKHLDPDLLNIILGAAKSYDLTPTALGDVLGKRAFDLRHAQFSKDIIAKKAYELMFKSLDKADDMAPVAKSFSKLGKSIGIVGAVIGGGFSIYEDLNNPLYSKVDKRNAVAVDAIAMGVTILSVLFLPASASILGALAVGIAVGTTISALAGFAKERLID